MRTAIAKRMWASVHMQELNRRLVEYEALPRYTLESVGTEIAGTVRFVEINQPPKELSFVLGDLINNLRTSLDYAACALLRRDDPQASVKYVQFPYGDKNTPLTSKQKRGSGVSVVSAESLNAIEHVRATYADSLELLNSLSNQDKHRLIVPVFFHPKPYRFVFSGTPPVPELTLDTADISDAWDRPLKTGDTFPITNAVKLDLGMYVDDLDKIVPVNALAGVYNDTMKALEFIAQELGFTVEI